MPNHKFITYIFVCDPDLCDARIDVTIREEHDFPNGVVLMTCPCGRVMNWIETTQPTNQIGEPTMTTIEAPVVTPDQQEIVYLKERVEILRKSATREREAIRSFFEALNDHVRVNELSIDDDIPLKELDDIIYEAFTQRMTFTKDYEVQVEHTIHTTFTITASSADEAEEMVNLIDITDQPEYDLPYEAEVSDWVLANTKIIYTGEK